MYYAGIGSRKTPEKVLRQIGRIAATLAKQGYTLRSGRAPGADLAFEKGAYMAQGNAEIYLPWAAFQENKGLFIPKLYEAEDWAWEVAERYHPRWKYLKFGAKMLHARNVHQIYGPTNKSELSKFVICWTKDGKETGGTAQAMRIARALEIPIYNLATDEGQRRAESLV